MIAIVDYGVGNLFSIQRSLDYLNIKSKITADENEIKNADKILLPGVGAFRDAADKLNNKGLDELVVSEAANGKPLLGICLGMQLFFDKSLEYGEHDGLGLIPGVVETLFDEDEYDLKIPQIGWNALSLTRPSPITKYLKDGDCVYFVHSYAAKRCENYVIATTEYGEPITAIVQNKNVFGTQFHPEKSGKVGLSILKAFDEI